MERRDSMRLQVSRSFILMVFYLCGDDDIKTAQKGARQIQAFYVPRGVSLGPPVF